MACNLLTSPRIGIATDNAKEIFGQRAEGKQTSKQTNLYSLWRARLRLWVCTGADNLGLVKETASDSFLKGYEDDCLLKTQPGKGI